jgi:hypothetical protein
MGVFKWDTRREDAAKLLAEDEITDEEIASGIGVSRQTLYNWKANPEFAARIDQHREASRKAILTRGLAVRERRVAALNDRWRRMQRVIRERAVSPQMQEVPGGPTGLMVHTVKGVGKGDDFQLIDLYEVDTGLLKELREHEKQAAQELGQWTEKRLIGGDPDNPLKILKGVSMDDL